MRRHRWIGNRNRGKQNSDLNGERPSSAIGPQVDSRVKSIEGNFYAKIT